MALTLATGSAQGTNCANLVPLYPTTGSYAFEKDDPGDAVMKNVAGSLDQPNRIRFAYQEIPNIFSNVPYNPAPGQDTSGISILIKVEELWKVDDASDSVAALLLPAAVHTVIRLPRHALVTPTVAADLYRRGVGAPFRNGTDTLSVAITSLVNGVTRF